MRKEGVMLRAGIVATAMVFAGITAHAAAAPTLGTTFRASVSTEGTEASASSGGGISVSSSGRFVAFASSATNLVAGDQNGLPDVFVKNLTDGSVQLASLAWDEEQANNGSRAASVSRDGTRVAFMSAASNLTQRFDVNGADDIFVRDLAAGTTALVSADPDGNYVEAESTMPSISADGRFVAFYSPATNLVPDDTNGVDDAFLRR